MAWSMSDHTRFSKARDNMVCRWGTHNGEFRLLYSMVCKPRGCVQTGSDRVGLQLFYLCEVLTFLSSVVTRILAFNCTKRDGSVFLQAILSKAAAQIRSCKLSIDASTLFEHVIFCTNVTHAHGGFKSGSFSLLES
jgi:hypothetical protein